MGGETLFYCAEFSQKKKQTTLQGTTCGTLADKHRVIQLFHINAFSKNVKKIFKTIFFFFLLSYS